MTNMTFGIRTKLILIFIVIKALPLIALAWFAGRQIHQLGQTVEQRTAATIADTTQLVGQIGIISTENSIQALDARSREAIERLTTDTARAVAAFLYDRDKHITLAAALPPDEDTYRAFMRAATRRVVEHQPWRLNDAGDAWVPLRKTPEGPIAVNDVPDNSKDFHSRPPEQEGLPVERPLYLEMTFVDLDGKERLKVLSDPNATSVLRDVSHKENTWTKAEDYFPTLKSLGQGDIYVSEVIGAYVGTPIVGPYTPQAAQKAGIPFEPEKAAYAGKENPVGKPFQGIIRWAAPVEKGGRRIGYVTLALDHTHLQEFTDHIVPTEERYSPISDAFEGNYAFMWDHKDRCITHPRDYFITGFDPATGEPVPPWLDSEIYSLWRRSGKTYADFTIDAPVFLQPSLQRKPAPELAKDGRYALDGRYLNFAPQCAGWKTLTQYGGSGSFVIFWSGLWKLTTAAVIPYHTGMYNTPRGFGYVTIGANVDEFHKAAAESAKQIKALASSFTANLETEKQSTLADLAASLRHTIMDLSISTVLMIVVVIAIAIWMASTLTRRITDLIRGIDSFTQGDMTKRLVISSNDEMGQLAASFNAMADEILDSLQSLRAAEGKYKAIFEHALDGIFQSTAEGRFVRVNPAMAHAFGYEFPEQMVEDVTDITNQLYVSPARRQDYMREIQERKEVTGFEVEFRRLDGTTFWAQMNARGVFNEDGALLYTEGALQDITARKLAAASLKKAKEEAEAANQMKTHFLSMVSHELRTPLTSVAGFVKIVKKKLSSVLFPLLDASDPKVAKGIEQVTSNLDIVIGEGARLTSLINDVLDLAKLEAGGLEWNVKTVSVPQLLDRAESSMKILAQEKGLDYRTEVEEGLPEVQGDADRILQVLINLISNAIKFTSQGGVVCRAEVQDEAIVVAVQDSGVGVAPDDREAVFDKFWQSGDLLTDKPKGTGLGLAICKEIVAYHGGKIWVESEPGKGSAFKFSLGLGAPKGLTGR